MRKVYLILVILVLFLTGCASASGTLGDVAGGGANYSYKSTSPDGTSCSVDINSSRDVNGGEVTIDKDCKMKVKVESATGVQALDVMGKFLDKVK